MIGPRRLRGSALAVLPFALLVSGCGLVLGLGDFTEGGGGSPGGTSSSSSGQPEMCAPGAKKPCLYTGPAGTEDIGPCHAGTQECNTDGVGFKACVGEILPAAKEDCSTDVDDDCNGQMNDGCPCTPGTMEPCYSGPAATKDVGTCVGGMHTCNAEGNGYGTCDGEVVPAIDVCSNATDEDCDGSVCGKTQWAKALNNVTINGIGVDGGGNIYVAGSLIGPFTMGAVSLSVTGGSGTDVVVLKFDPAGTIVWGKQFGSTANETANGIAVDAAGNVHFTGYSSGSVDFGGGLLPGVFVVKLNPAGGHLWSKGCGGTTSFSYGKGIAVDSMGNVLVTGHFGGTLSCAVGQSVTSVGATASDVFVLRMSGVNGGLIWTKGFGEAMVSEIGTGIAAAANGDALVTGWFFTSIKFGDVNSTLMSDLTRTIFVAKLTAAAGAHIWSKGGSGTSDSEGASIAVDAKDNPIFTGYHIGAMMFAGKAVTVAPTGGASDILFGKLDGATGDALWLNGYGSSNADMGSSVAVSGAGRIALGGEFRNSADFGGGALASANLDAAFLATFEATPTQHLWSKQFSSSKLGPDETRAVAYGPAGEVVAGGKFYGTVDFGPTSLTETGGATSFLVRVAP